ncbi:aliphatic sulfonate ABC transporter substrate-binding protein [Azotobacter chroococcum]|uniref:Putative aliphatic sulfonates-binding protein n=2 Tax=Azotobacter chroococcum TaxID=353 RepID=A0A0C4WSW4_9GAMM|nr:aliphatic sulfonate ABC transporter substrate-binding protein [Azotobacter chroococcum]AJE23729.1 ABC transporter, aliphatic sulfonate binding protein [Azotobacter chroococcum NCIMB 8003]QQE91183.1 aliphatic sulfonate ABC transporter substrate-binding protein [Azotobacter chroococcum]TBV93300.1 aliphatic sulfonate ABC transporter substrate-binding protein [Azotobacter chroococcum]TCL18312.1 sulfonate transport system substrate-binding protein [Azotobacter chroococcum]TKD43422.1 aliphatic su
MKTFRFGSFLLGLLAFAQVSLADPAVLRIGYQKASSSLVLAKQHGLLERRFPQTRIDWIEFPAGPQMLEALNIGSLDIGSTGDIPPLFAQAAGADLLYIGAEPAKPQAEVILVAPDSPIHSIAELKGRKVALQKGSSAHNLLLRALARAGLSFRDIQPVYLSPADARAAFESGRVDAWAIWDPFYSAVELEGRARLLANGEGLELLGPFYLAARPYAESDPDFVKAVLDELGQAERRLQSDRAGSIRLLATFTGLPEAVIERTFSHRPASSVLPMSAEIVAAQQRTADLFLESRLLPKRIDVAAAVWRP